MTMISKRNVFIHRTAKIYPGVTIEDNCYIGPFCCIGARSEFRGNFMEQVIGKVIIRNGATLTGFNTIDSGSEGITEIGANAFLMKHVHIGHDCVLQENVTIAPHTTVAGHVTIGQDTNIGMNCTIHQKVAIPKRCMIGMLTPVTKKAAKMMKAQETWVGNPARKLGMNKKWI